jgi:UDP-glucose 4-epimerase
MRPEGRRGQVQDLGPVLVTGGAGFVGSHIAGKLSQHRPVHVLDDLSTGSIDRLPPGVAFHLGDVSNRADIERVLGSTRFSAVIHCAAQTSVARSMAMPAIDWQVNVLGTHRLARHAAEMGIERFVYLSSGGAIYGETDHPAVETDLPAPQSHYGLNKLAAEQIVRLEARSYAILRPSNIYGPGQRSDLEGGVVAIFLERLLADDAVEIHGDGSQRRDFIHVEDVVRAVEVALAERRNVIWNVASGESTSIATLYRVLLSSTRGTDRARLCSRRAGDIASSVLSPDALIAQGWGPPRSLIDGLTELVEAQAIEKRLQESPDASEAAASRVS